MKINKTSMFTKKSHIIALITCLSLLIAAAGYFYYKSEESSIRQQKYNELKAIADLKVNQIKQWLKDRNADVKVATRSTVGINQWLKDTVNVKLKQDIIEQLKPVQEERGYENIILATPNGRLLLSAQAGTQEFDSFIQQKIIEASEKRKILFTDFYWCQTDNKIHYDIILPIINDRKNTIAVLLFRIDPNLFLYPLIQTWPTPSKSSETALLRVEKDSVVFLNELRHRKNTALRLKIPLTRTETPSVQAALGRTGLFEGIDYRGVPVLSDIRIMPVTNWIMLSKVDKSEIFSDLYVTAGVVSGFSFLLIIICGVGFVFIYSSRQKNIFMELYKKEKELWQHQERFKVTIDSLGDGVITTDLNGKIQFLNKRGEELTEWNLREARGRMLSEIYSVKNEETGQIENNILEKIFKHGIVKELANHTILISKSGKEIPVMDTGAPIFDIDGSVTGVVITFQDETEKRRQQRRLEESERRYRLLVDTIPDTSIMVFDNDHRFLVAGGEEISKSGFDRNLVEGRTLSEAYPPDVTKLFAPLYNKALKGESTIFEHQYKELHYHQQILPIYDSHGNIFAGMVISRNITERKRAEEALRMADQRRKLHFEQTPLAVIEWDLDFKVRHWNPAAESIFGFTLDEAMGQHASFIVPETARQHVDRVWNDLLQKRGGERSMNENIRKDGRFIICEWYNTPLVDEREGIIGVASLVEDITERKQAEINLKRREAILETISISAEKFLTAKNIDEPINETLRLLYEATDASRVYIFKFHYSDDGKLLTSQTHESVKEGITPQIDNAELQNLDLISAGYNRWVKTFEKHEPIVGLVKNFPDSEIEILRDQDIQSIVVTPIYVFEKLYGFIGFDECLYERSWSKPEIEALQAVSNLIAGAIVTEENRKELVENEERLRSIINSTPLGSHVYEIIDDDLILTDANSSANIILGVDHKKLKNKNIKDVFPLLGFSGIIDEFKKVAITGKSFTKHYIISGEGIFTGIFEFFAFQIKKNSMALFFRDVSEQKKLELRIQKSEERFKLASQATHDSIWDWDLVRDKVWWSENMNKIFDLDIGNKETDIKKWYELLHPADLQRVEAKIKKAINSEQEYWSDEYRLLRGDGKYAFVVDRGYIIRDKYRKPTRMVGSIIDYTEKIRHEQELIAAKEKAEEANRLKSGFISAMSHEIRTPLNIILGYNDLIEDMYCDPANEEILSYFNSITNNGNRLIDTITKILDISRIEAGEFPITLQPIPIKEILDSTYSSMKILADKKKLSFVLNLPAENISVLADAYCLENSLINLVNNAIKYSEKGTIEISLKKEDKFAVCKIKDEGIGMSESYQKHLFQTFSQEKVGVSRPYEGVGLGLALTKKYVERMQAGIEIQSKEGRGSTVTLKIPLAN